jgi:phosphopantetheine adenylyltransferase
MLLHHLPVDIWSRLLVFLPSEESLCLYATGCSVLCTTLRQTVHHAHVGVLPKRSLALWSNLEEITFDFVLRRVSTIDLSIYPQLRKFVLPYAIESSLLPLAQLSHLTHLKVEVKEIQSFLQLLTAPLVTLSVSSEMNCHSHYLVHLPKTLCRLRLAMDIHGSLIKPLPDRITDFVYEGLGGELLNRDLAHLGLPPLLRHLEIPYSINSAEELMNHLPHNLETFIPGTLVGFGENHVKLLPSSLKSFQLSHIRFTQEILANIPRHMTKLVLRTRGSVPIGPLIPFLPQTLDFLDINQISTLQDDDIINLPRTIRRLAISNGSLTGKATLDLPPGLISLTILGSWNNTTPQQPWFPFCLDPAYMSRLPLSLTALQLQKMPYLPNTALERFSNGLTSFLGGNEYPGGIKARIYNCLFDLREVTSIEEAIYLTELMRKLLPEVCTNPPCRLIVYTAFPQTIEFCDGVVNEHGKVDDVLSFMKIVQGLYDIVSSGEKTLVSTHETHIILLPSSDITKLPHIRHIICPHDNRRLRASYPHSQWTQIGGRTFVRSKSIVRLSLSSFELFDDVAVGGTFDYMHTGHRMLLGTCLLTARKRLVIGVTGDPLLVKKTHKEYIQAYETRKRNVELFCKLQRPDLYVEAVQLFEPAGPTATDPNFDLIVVSEETAAGIGTINTIREKNGLKPMKGLVIHLAESYGSMKNLSQDTKISSTTLRLRQKLIDEYLYGANPSATPPSYVTPNIDADFQHL